MKCLTDVVKREWMRQLKFFGNALDFIRFLQSSDYSKIWIQQKNSIVVRLPISSRTLPCEHLQKLYCALIEYINANPISVHVCKVNALLSAEYSQQLEVEDSEETKSVLKDGFYYQEKKSAETIYDLFYAKSFEIVEKIVSVDKIGASINHKDILNVIRTDLLCGGPFRQFMVTQNNETRTGGASIKFANYYERWIDPHTEIKSMLKVEMDKLIDRGLFWIEAKKNSERKYELVFALCLEVSRDDA
ncbi:hypothetical protein ACOME3_003841 [Neoechinorhynchus agilis]